MFNECNRGLRGAVKSLLQARHVFPDHTHIPEVTPTTRDKKSRRSATSTPAAWYDGPGVQLGSIRQSRAASSARLRQRGLCHASYRTQAKEPITGSTYKAANTPKRVMSLSSLEVLWPALFMA
ncbi:hypothetical protein L798_01926 [Zootermopsis nevadensis]|uniref:Uncharacterized protein n=1 Tax=Zootermopsis nevadensis TaxID=136037 RepID=A0A067QV29_ZOONE|nr:hypothetical protein L798_01926 [Zootermopsis nevadensis]